MKQLSIEEVAAFCKRKGFVYPTSDIYGGISGFFDYGPLGVELHNNIKQSWWSFFVQQREDVVGMNGSIISHPKVWDASGHTSSFNDLLLACSNKDCKQKVRADHFIEDHLQVRGDGLTTAQINQLINENNLVCSSCKSPFEEVKDLNVMFHTSVGALGEGSKAFLRPETAQLIFTNFKLVAENARMKLPFGIAQIGKVFRNEISPRDFLFRVREFEQLELEYFVHPDKYDCPFLDEVKEVELLLYSADMQENDETPDTMNLLTAFKQKIIKTGWHVYWMGKLVLWLYADVYVI